MKSFEQWVCEKNPDLDENWKTNLALLGAGAVGFAGAGKGVKDYLASKKPDAQTAAVAKTEPVSARTAPDWVQATTLPVRTVPNASGEMPIVWGGGKLRYEQPKFWNSELSNRVEKLARHLMTRGAKGVNVQQVYGDTQGIARKGVESKAAIDVGSHDLNQFGFANVAMTPLENGKTIYTVIYSTNPLTK
jgi:hypothetical protein